LFKIISHLNNNIRWICYCFMF